jgi:hypothetical protein
MAAESDCHQVVEGPVEDLPQPWAQRQLREHASVDQMLRSGDVGGFVRREEQNEVGHLLRICDATEGNLSQGVAALFVGGLHHHRSLDEPRVHGIDANVLGSVFDGCRFRHAADCELACDVRQTGEPVVRGHAGDRRDVDDGADTGSFHGGQNGFHPEEHTVLVDTAHLPVVALGKLCRRGQRAENPCIVHQHIDLAERVHTLFDGICP